MSESERGRRRRRREGDGQRDFTEVGDRDEKMTVLGAAHLSIWAYSSAIQCGNEVSASSSSMCSVGGRVSLGVGRGSERERRRESVPMT